MEGPRQPRETEGKGEKRGDKDNRDIRRYPPAALDEICQNNRQIPICSCACLGDVERAVGGSRIVSPYDEWIVIQYQGYQLAGQSGG